jgi:hypothetical protein
MEEYTILLETWYTDPTNLPATQREDSMDLKVFIEEPNTENVHDCLLIFNCVIQDVVERKSLPRPIEEFIGGDEFFLHRVKRKPAVLSGWKQRWEGIFRMIETNIKLSWVSNEKLLLDNFGEKYQVLCERWMQYAVSNPSLWSPHFSNFDLIGKKLAIKKPLSEFKKELQQC